MVEVPVNHTFEALAHVRRREVLRILRKHDRLSAGQIAERLAIPRPTLSGHLNILKGADLIIGEREGTTIWYRLNLTVMEEALGLALSLLSRQPIEEGQLSSVFAASPSAAVYAASPSRIYAASPSKS
ncbi:metalloregulator ArsR/SmtB family transcription factor [Nonomuraea sp. NPDC049419]|uniref:metalloregulator ArsR/SmtB family transcription factor n=1 Tax=Nonomuraea sp. NPDC049419 TaxID=3155772 RepID=UPI003426AF01